MRIGLDPTGAKHFLVGFAGGVPPPFAETARLRRQQVRKENIRFVESQPTHEKRFVRPAIPELSIATALERR
jgi:hypothetical protein